jgi:hypothetical protein
MIDALMARMVLLDLISVRRFRGDDSVGIENGRRHRRVFVAVVRHAVTSIPIIGVVRAGY